ncbi:MAG: flagellar hook-basal body protein [Phycisphaerae bacterium]|nr:flagellar hook-basal body protein [Phycisphaerae bacterium]
MLYGLYVSAAGAMANSYRQDVATNNLANVGTVAFKSDLAMLKARRTEASLSGQQHSTTALLEGIGGGTYALPNRTVFKQGPLSQTERPLDLALNGQGFFQIQKDDQTLYTRDGRLSSDTNNQLITATGQHPILDIQGRPIIIDPSSNVEINPAGMVVQNGELIGQLGIVDFDDKSVLKKQGENLFVADQSAKPTASAAVVSQGHIEESDVNAIDQQVKLMKYFQLFNMNSQMLKIQDRTLEMAVSQIAKIG